MVLLATHEWHPEGTDANAGMPVAVLIHGITGWWRTWWRVGPALADAGWRVVALDLRGHGGSPAMETPVTREDLASDVAETVEALGAAPVDVVIGHSLGAAVALELAHARPELMRRVVLEDPPGGDRSNDPGYRERLRAGFDAAAQRPDQEVARYLAENPTWLEEDARQAVEGQQHSDADGITESLSRGMGSRVPELVPILTVPALYLLAAEDRSAIQGDPRQKLLGGVPSGSQALEFDAGHTVHRDAFDEYMARLLAWLAETDRS